MKGRLNLHQAIDTLYSRGHASTEAYTRLLLDCFRANDVDQAKRLQTHMELHFYEPVDTFIPNRLLHLFAKSGKLSDARNLFDKMPKRDVISWNAMLSAYAKMGLIEDLRELFDRMPLRDSVSYNTAITGLTREGLPAEAMEVFLRMRREGFEPTNYTLVSALSTCSQLVNLRCGKQIHGRIVVSGWGSNVFLSNCLTDLYAKCGEIDQARWLFDRMKRKNVVSWNLMISGYLKTGQPEKCISLFREMQSSGLKPDEITLSNILGAYFQSGLIDEAGKIFRLNRAKDKVCWTTMISGYAQNGKEENALMLFGDMLAENVKPDTFTFSSVISCCAKLASLWHGQVAHGKAIQFGVDIDLLVSSTLINMYCKCGVTADAWFLFNLMPTRNVVCWNAMIGGYAQNGQDLEALALYEKMLQENLKPDEITFVSVLSACIHAALLEEGQRYFDSISERHEMTPNLDHYACMIYLLGRSGCMDKALNLIKGMPYKPNSLIWSTLLSVSAMKGDVKHGEMAAKNLFELDPMDAGPYIMLSNIYAACGRLEDVAHIRSLMKDTNVKKFAAYSWVEIDNRIHRFVSDDRTHPDTVLIYAELNRLIKKLQETGFNPDTKLVLHDVGEDEKFESICYHSEKLALAFWLIKKPHGGTPIRILKNIRVCGDCHVFMKFISKTTGRHIILRDSTIFHHFVAGKCSCKDYW
ncbi:PPR domain-containing protein/PPR_2 domain-containing protein/DYW_deaminase domain-containing protein [Cephalotus follicularis]|uniref:PPR domain-containing protein/PPR_2 domain-containing protein/DYW_deaminase domain-containing protein n=1 Tax=Cephalotus follicularis TaxID=3775 RepID=A0A1Q3D507_CEPFO|nr:PPR domain-containing protein/PPR_2 domain-containing protein/DYW_deaminase domain-containing protein [Cephalotus follicularis]